MFFANSLVVFWLALNALAYPLEVVEAEDGEAFALVPLSRVDGKKVLKADVYASADMADPGRAIVGLKGTPIDTDIHRLDTSLRHQKHQAPFSDNKRIGSCLPTFTDNNLDLSVVNTPQYGTDFKASGKYNFFQDGTTNANVEGFYERQATGRSDHGVMFNFRKGF